MAQADIFNDINQPEARTNALLCAKNEGTVRIDTTLGGNYWLYITQKTGHVFAARVESGMNYTRPSSELPAETTEKFNYLGDLMGVVAKFDDLSREYQRGFAQGIGFMATDEIRATKAFKKAEALGNHYQQLVAALNAQGKKLGLLPPTSQQISLDTVAPTGV